MDDWAIRRGHNYGTIRVDQQRRKVIDLLPGRDGEALKPWLLAHPGVKVISRDRASAYAQAASQAAPKAKQVADRWHLLKNLREMLERFFERHRKKVQSLPVLLTQQTASSGDKPAQPQQEVDPAQAVTKPDATSEQAVEPMTGLEQAQPSRRRQRQERYEEVRRRHGEGQAIRQIAQQMSLSRNAVRCYLRSSRCPDWRPGQARRSRLDRFSGWIDEQILAGRDNAAEFHGELTAKGYKGSAQSVRRFVTKRLAALRKRRERANAAVPRSPPVPSSRSLAFDVLRRDGKRDEQQRARVIALREADEEFGEVMTLAEEFLALVRKERVMPLAEWLRQAEGARSVELRGFAQGVAQDEGAVAAAMSEPWSNGQVEGQVNRLKTLKRQMYGRAGLGLLRRKALAVQLRREASENETVIDFPGLSF